MVALLTVLLLSAMTISSSLGRHAASVIKPLSARISHGTWGSFHYCPDGQWAKGFQLKTERELGPKEGADDTALNGIVLFCAGHRAGGVSPWSKSVTSSVGEWGFWGAFLACDADDEIFFVGAEFRSEPEQGIKGDDTAGNNLNLRCSNGQWRKGDGLGWGTWSSVVTCPANSAICGLKTMVEASLGTKRDDTALNEVEFACCSL